MRKTFILLFIAAASLVTSCSEKEDIVTIHTDFGDIVLLLFKETPKHKENFIKLTKEGTYDSTTFHRVMQGFMIQGGDPNSKDDDINNDGQGGPGYTVPQEFNPNLTHIKGALAAARQPDQVNPEKASSGSQFYLVHDEEGTRHLNGSYTIFGQTISGLEILDEIAAQPVGRGNRPLSDIRMTVEVKSMTRKKIAKEYGYAFE